MEAYMWTKDIGNKANVATMGPSVIETVKKLQNIISTWMRGVFGYLGYSFEHLEFEDVMFPTITL